ncbi:unnamed protein product [Cyprideis torosa]|uniref:Large ribosomal subunit protein uL24m n=1 Tax=Cyprideis torosa TaxID=163714 RepID=A0A7R8W7I0_9CRUS|nr:unnamed protein product [Cyprideis torosa]CAG0882216.1 unnamed protein product [Cyprideis torosa]
MRLTNVCLCTWKKIHPLTKQLGNLPDRYLKRAVDKVYLKMPKGKQFVQAEEKRTRFRFSINRPWTLHAQIENNPEKSEKDLPIVEPIKEWSFFKGDRVEILVGKDKGKQGTVIQVIPERNWVLVEGLNCDLKHQKVKSSDPGFWVLDEKPLLVNRHVRLVDPGDSKPTMVEWRFTEEGERVRVSSRSGRIIPMPVSAEETIDYKTKESYRDGLKDTDKDDVAKVTFEAPLATFEMDIMKQMGIKDDRVPRKVYWYY